MIFEFGEFWLYLSVEVLVNLFLASSLPVEDIDWPGGCICSDSVWVLLIVYQQKWRLTVTALLPVDEMELKLPLGFSQQSWILTHTTLLHVSLVPLSPSDTRDGGSSRDDSCQRLAAGWGGISAPSGTLAC